MHELRPALRRYIASVYTGGVLSIVLALSAGLPVGENWLLALVLLGLICAVESMPVQYEEQIAQTMATLYLAAAYALHPVTCVVIVVCGQAVFRMRKPSPWYKVGFNVSVALLCVVCTAWLFDRLHLVPTAPLSFTTLLPIASVLVVYTGIMYLPIGIVVTLAQDQPLAQLWSTTRTMLNPLDLILTPYSIILVALWFVSPLSFVVGLLPLAAVQWAVTTHARLLERERELQASHEQLVQAERLAAVGKVTASIAHNFNNVLATIASTAELALWERGADEQRTALTIVAHTAQRGAGITRGLLAFTRQLPPTRTTADMQAEIDMVVNLVHAECIRSNIEIVRALDEVPPLVCDARLLAQAVLNLVTNAIDAMAPLGGGVLTIGLSQAQQQIHIWVRDTGVGIDPAIQARIFEPFATSKHEGAHFGGTGLGLATTHGIVTDHGGTITVDSEPGTGTTMHLYLPIADAPVLPPQHLEPLRRGTPLRVRVVDDEMMLAQALADMVAMAGHEVEWFTDPLVACDARDWPHVDMAFVDLTMPHLDGLSLLQHIKQGAPNLVPVLVTGHLDVQQRALQHELGAKVIYKPFSVSEIHALVGIVGQPAMPVPAAALSFSSAIAPEPFVQHRSVQSALQHQLLNYVGSLEAVLPMAQHLLDPHGGQAALAASSEVAAHLTRNIMMLSSVVRTQHLLFHATTGLHGWSQLLVLHEQVASVVQVLRGTMPCDIVMRQCIPADLQIRGHATYFGMALLAALTNAVEALQANDGNDRRLVMVCAERHADRVHLVITDTGPGFPAAVLAHTPTMSSTPAHAFIGITTKRGQPGLGLALMVEVARLHKGNVVFENDEAGGGARVTFHIPYAT